MDFEKDLNIDRFSLEKEWVEQPKLFMRYAEIYAEAKKEADKAKENLETVRAELYHIVRDSIDGKVTEALISAAVQKHPRHKKATTDLLEKKFRADLCTSAIKAFEQRKSALENLVKLFLADYYSDPKTEQMNEKFKDELTKEEVNSRLRRRATHGKQLDE